eukprot:SAG31_NODE_1801_length_7238_cov_4.423449_1_plen_78_part_00
MYYYWGTKFSTKFSSSPVLNLVLDSTMLAEARDGEIGRTHHARARPLPPERDSTYTAVLDLHSSFKYSSGIRHAYDS